MANHWFLKEKHVKFRESIANIIVEASRDVCRPDAKNTLGDEHDQCQYLFTKIYTLMWQRQTELTHHLLCCSRVPDPVIELRYYRSRRRRAQSSGDPQFVEKETGADFALTLRVDLPGILKAERSILGQAKIITPPSVQLAASQLSALLGIAGPESAAYLLWQVDYPPTVVSAENVAAHARTQQSNRLYSHLFSLGQSLADFFCDAFLGLWFGKDYDPQKEGDNPPDRSIPILYHFLHGSDPPPNVIYLGIGSGGRIADRPGVYVTGITDIGSQSR